MGIWPGALRIVEMRSRYTPRRVRSVMAKDIQPMTSDAQITLSGTAIVVWGGRWLIAGVLVCVSGSVIEGQAAR